MVLLEWCAFPFAGGLVEVACLKTWQPCCQPYVVLAGKMLFHLEENDKMSKYTFKTKPGKMM